MLERYPRKPVGDDGHHKARGTRELVRLSLMDSDGIEGVNNGRLL